MRNVLYALGAAGLAVAMAGCTSIAKMGVEEMVGQKADVEVIKPITSNLKGYRKVEVEQFTSGIGGLAPAALVDALQGNVIAAFKKRGLFPSVVASTPATPSEPTLLVGGTVTDYKPPAEGMKRVISKDSLFSVNVVVKDKGTGEEIGRAIARGRLATMFRGDERTLMEKAAESVARFVNEAHTPSPKKMDQIKAKLGGKS